MYNIIASGSTGNATIIDNKILIDCGVPYTSIKKYVKYLKLILLTHIHTDHFKKSTIKRLAKDRPSLRFGCGSFLVGDLIKCGVKPKQIDVYDNDKKYSYSDFYIKSFKLYHNVLNVGYKLNLNGYKVIYATDTNKIDTIAKGYDLYLIESNFDEEEITKRIEDKLNNNEKYIYEYSVLENHLSKQKCLNFIYDNIDEKGEYIFMHQHKKKGIELE